VPNRRELVRRIDEATARPEAAATLLILDLDYFKQVNDLYGHGVGDRLLRRVAEMLQASVPHSACCVRLGGDEFAILLPDYFGHDDVSALAERILALLSDPIRLEEATTQISASLGIAALDAATPDSTTLLRRADIAMYSAKRAGRNCFAWFEAEMEEEITRRTRLEAEIRAGIDRGEFVPYFQPLVLLSDNKLKGFEVLARWQHPERGILLPEAFIAVAEQSALISELSFNVMRQALIEAKDWPGHLAIAVNVSPIQFRDGLLAQRILRLLTETGFPPQRLEIEVTESALLEDRDLAVSIIQSLQNFGIRISIDDFGTGYASFSQLKALPFDRIKIDRSFVTSLTGDPQNTAIVETIAKLGVSLSLPITAEGVETEAVLKQLKSIGCSEAQGWLFSKAIPASAVLAMLAESDESPTSETARPKRAARSGGQVTPRRAAG
jgi:diguanylate cyclase (GGDEF)-like protein